MFVVLLEKINKELLCVALAWNWKVLLAELACPHLCFTYSNSLAIR